MSRRLLAVVAVLVPLGFATKLYRGPAEAWVHGSLGGVFYVCFWCLAVLALRPRLPPWRVATVVLAITSALEFLQLWHPPLLQQIRATFLGRTLIGTTFSWSDFPYYAAGALAAVAVARWLERDDVARR